MDLTCLMPETQQKIQPAHDGSGCWNWHGCTAQGYGIVTVYSRKQLIHRVMYELANGRIAEGLSIHHLCYNKRCCNPAHLEAITKAENGRRGGLRSVLGSRAAMVLQRTD